MQAPDRCAEEDTAEPTRQGEDGVRDRQRRDAAQQQSTRSEAVGQDSGGVGAARIDEVHRHQEHRNPGRSEAGLLSPHQQERLRKPRHHEQHAEHRRRPERPRQATHVREAYRRGARRQRRSSPLRFLHPDDQHRDRERGGYHREPQHRPHLVDESHHQQHRQQRPGDRTRRIERLPQSVGRAPQSWLDQVRDQRVARRAAYPLAQPVDQSRHDHRAGAVRHRERRLGDGRQPIPRDRQPLAMPETVAEPAREHLRDQAGGLGQPLEQPESRHAHAEHRRQVVGQQGVDQLRRSVHQQRGQPERPDASRQLAQCRPMRHRFHGASVPETGRGLKRAATAARHAEQVRGDDARPEGRASRQSGGGGVPCGAFAACRNSAR